ncbi:MULTISPECIES: hypothetical protein [unclassified Mycobacterium]|uniref:hypothetical protein n=1 Tax=unclassified Mycobacterium TaxID=2642494 RepID=UPI001E4EA859|nr:MULTISPECIES: hypothetical protein [unclassified Mycobacterium]
MRRDNLTPADLCDQIEQKIHLNADNQRPPEEFGDWQMCVAGPGRHHPQAERRRRQLLPNRQAPGVEAAGRRRLARDLPDRRPALDVAVEQGVKPKGFNLITSGDGRGASPIPESKRRLCSVVRRALAAAQAVRLVVTRRIVDSDTEV